MKNNSLESVRWDLSPFYKSIHDKKIASDIETVKINDVS